jgi:hypothetical protein
MARGRPCRDHDANRHSDASGDAAQGPVVAKELIAATPQTNSVSPNDLSSSGPSARQIEPPARTASPEGIGHCQSRREARLALREISGPSGRTGAGVNDLPIEHAEGAH